MKNKTTNVLLHLIIAGVSTYMAIYLGDTDSFFTSVFCALALIEAIKFAHWIALPPEHSRISKWLKLSDVPIKAIFLYSLCIANIGGLIGVFVMTTSLIIGFVWVVFYIAHEENRRNKAHY